MYIAVSLALVLVIFVLLYIAKSLRLDLEHRQLHSRYVCFTIVYSTLCVIGFAGILIAVNSILSVPAIRDGLYRIAPEVNTASSFYWIVTLLANIIFLLGFDFFLLLIKKIWIPFVIRNEPAEDYLISDDINGIERLFHRMSNIFYDENVLKPAAMNIGSWIRAMKNIFGAILLIEALALTAVIGAGIEIIPAETLSMLTKSLYMIPMASYVILNQLEIFLCADVRIDDGLVDTEEIGEKIIGDYAPLIKLYESLFGGRALISYYTKGEGDFTHSLHTGVDENQLKKAKDPELLYSVYRCLENAVSHVSVKYVDSLVDLINGENVAVVDSVCGEYNIYFLSYLQHRLMLHKKALVICDTMLQVEDTIEKYGEIFKCINRASQLWRIGKSCDMEEGNVDILVCTEEELIGGRLKYKYARFFSEISNIVIVDSYGLICRDKAFLTRLFNYINEGDIQYTFFTPENNPDIKTVLEEYIKRDIVVYDNYNETTNTCIMYWRGEPALKSQGVLSENLQNDLGIAYTISLVAARYDVPDINIQAHGAVPIYSYRNTATGEYASIIASEFFHRESLDINSMIKINDLLVFNPKELAFNVIYDENNNLLSLTKMWLSYGGRYCSMLHMVSRPYMLRDYFACNLAELYGVLADIKMFVPMKVLSSRAAALAFLIKTRMGVQVEEIQEFARLNGIEEVSAERILERLIAEVFGAGHGHRVYESFAFDELNTPVFADDRYTYTHTVRMTSQMLYEDLCRMTVDNAVLVDRDCKTLLPINKNDISNHYLPGCCYAFDGIRYSVEEIIGREIHVRREETVAEDKEYTALYNIRVENAAALDSRSIAEKDAYSLKFFEADITREIWGYIEHSNGIDFSRESNTEVKRFTDAVAETKRTGFLEIEFSAEALGEYEKVAALLTVTIRGALETLLPKNYKDILVFSKIDKSALYADGEEACAPLGEKKVLGLLPDVQSDCIKGNDAQKIRVYIVGFSAVESGALSAIADDLDRLLQVIKKYLDWAMTDAADKKTYLHFGLDRIPGIFSPHMLSVWLGEITSRAPAPQKTLDGSVTIAASRFCAFCGRPIIVSGILLSDGRAMCADCAKHRANTKREVKVLLRRAYTVIQDKYGVKIPPGIGIKFVRQEVVNNIVGVTPGKICLGVWVPNKRNGTVYVVRGGPENNVLSTLIHELVHAWQAKEAPWVQTDYEPKYCEGHSMYVEIECMYALHATEFAKSLEKETAARDDEYGKGFVMWRDYIAKQQDKNIFHHVMELRNGIKIE